MTKCLLMYGSLEIIVLRGLILEVESLGGSAANFSLLVEDSNLLLVGQYHSHHLAFGIFKVQSCQIESNFLDELQTLHKWRGSNLIDYRDKSLAKQSPIT